MKTLLFALSVFIFASTQSFAQNSALQPDQPQVWVVQPPQTPAPTEQIYDDNRLDIYLGIFAPTGKIEELDIVFETGFNMGIGYNLFLTENFGVGVFFDLDIFPSKDFEYTETFHLITSTKKDYFTLLNMLIGGQAAFQIPINPKNFLYASTKVGYGHASATSGMLTKFNYTGDDVAFIFEGGFRHKINTVDFGTTLKYTSFKTTMNSKSNTLNLPSSLKMDLSGVSIAFDMGILF